MNTNKFGLQSKDWQILQNLLISPLKKYGCALWVFGSRATGKEQKFSDIDILYQRVNAIPSGLIGEILENLEESDLSIKVDLVATDDLAESYRTQVEADKIALQRM